MSVTAPAKLGLYAIVLSAAFGVGTGLGALRGPEDDIDRPPEHVADTEQDAHAERDPHDGREHTP